MPAAASAPTRDGRWLRLVRSALVERLPLKAVALFFALVLWLAVSADEPGEQTMRVRLAIRVDSTLALAGAAPPVRATLTGRRRDLLKLRPGDLVLRRTIAVAGADSVRLVLRPSDVELPPGTEGDVRVRDVQPRRVTLRFASSHAPRAAASGARPAVPPPAAGLPAAPAPDPTADEAALERAPDTLWQAGAPDSASRPAIARRTERGDTTAIGSRPPDIIILPSDSPTVIDTARVGARSRRRSRGGASGAGSAGGTARGAAGPDARPTPRR